MAAATGRPDRQMPPVHRRSWRLRGSAAASASSLLATCWAWKPLGFCSASARPCRRPGRLLPVSATSGSVCRFTLRRPSRSPLSHLVDPSAFRASSWSDPCPSRLRPLRRPRSLRRSFQRFRGLASSPIFTASCCRFVSARAVSISARAQAAASVAPTLSACFFSPACRRA